MLNSFDIFIERAKASIDDKMIQAFLPENMPDMHHILMRLINRLRIVNELSFAVTDINGFHVAR